MCPMRHISLQTLTFGARIYKYIIWDLSKHIIWLAS